MLDHKEVLKMMLQVWSKLMILIILFFFFLVIETARYLLFIYFLESSSFLFKSIVRLILYLFIDWEIFIGIKKSMTRTVNKF